MNQPLYVYYHTHWDREWYLPFREYQHRLLKVVDDVLTAVEGETLPCFTLDGQTVLLEDYLAFRPENRSLLEALIQGERLSVGPWYVMPDEFLVSGESLIRNLQRGLEISRAFGEKTFTGYLPDTFGHSADIPMILQQFGIDSAIIWRGISPQAPLFWWISPSGDKVLTYHLTEGYFQNVFHMGESLAEKSEFFQGWLDKVRSLTPEGMPILFPVGADHLGIVPDAPALMRQFAQDSIPVTVDTFMEKAHSIKTNALTTLNGELRDEGGAYILPGVYSARLYLKQWNRRLEWRLTRQLEQLLVWQQLLGIESTPTHELDFLWKTLLLNHPHDSICGCSVDAVHRENEVRFEEIDELSTALLRDAHFDLRQRLQPKESALLINLSDTTYTGVVELQGDYPLSQPVPEPLPNSQVLSEEEILDESFLTSTSILPLSENKALRRRSLIWVSTMPAHGIQTVSGPTAPPSTVSVTERSLENHRIRVTINASGDLTVEDLQNGQTYPNLHQLRRSLEQGDSYNAAPVPGAPPEQAVFRGSRIVHAGPLRGTLALTYAFPNIEMALETTVSLDAGSFRLDFETAFTNTASNHKVQVLFYTHQPLTEVIAEGHFAPVRREYDAAYRIEDQMPAPKMKELKVQGGPIQRFIGFQDQTILTEGLTEYEVEGDNLKLTLLRAFGMLSKPDTGVRGSHAGPPLPTPEGQCLNRPMTFRYAWLPGFDLAEAYHQADWVYGAVYGFDRQKTGNTTANAMSFSFVDWDNPTVQATAMLPQGGSWHLRLLNPTAEPQRVRLTFKNPPSTLCVITLDGQIMEALSAPETVIPPYRIQTIQIPLQ